MESYRMMPAIAVREDGAYLVVIGDKNEAFIYDPKNFVPNVPRDRNAIIARGYWVEDNKLIKMPEKHLLEIQKVDMEARLSGRK